jgi:heterodisulfide reductase subunit B
MTALLDRDTWLSIAARNLAISEELGLDLVTTCNGCYETLFEANETLKTDEAQRRRVNSLIEPSGKKYRGSREVKHIVEVLHGDVSVERIRSAIEKPLEGLRVASHPGCHLFRSRGLDDYDLKAKMLDDLIGATGAELVDYKLKRMCCGFPQRQADEEYALKETLRVKLENIAAVGVDCIAVVCPSCQMQFELGQLELKRRFNLEFNIPVVNLSELLALSMGISPKGVGLETHIIPVKGVLERVGLV